MTEEDFEQKMGHNYVKALGQNSQTGRAVCGASLSGYYVKVFYAVTGYPSNSEATRAHGKLPLTSLTSSC